MTSEDACEQAFRETPEWKGMKLRLAAVAVTALQIAIVAVLMHSDSAVVAELVAAAAVVAQDQNLHTHTKKKVNEKSLKHFRNRMRLVEGDKPVCIAPTSVVPGANCIPGLIIYPSSKFCMIFCKQHNVNQSH